MLAAGQELSTQKGRAEILLTPGIFLRVGDESSVRMVSPGLADTVVALERGRAMVEVAQIHPENDVRIEQSRASAQLLKPGLYDFDAEHHQIRVFDGKAAVQEGDRKTDVKGGHELDLTNPKFKTQSFDKKAYEDDFYRWSSLRSSYLAEANVDVARRYALNNSWYPGYWYGPGWYWDPWFSAYTFVPANGLYYSPFGWGFYSPAVVYGAPYFWHGGGFYRHFGPGYHPLLPAPRAHAPGFVGRAPGFQGGFRTAPGGGFRAPRAGGGFHGFGGGGFHGGGRGR